MAKKGFSHRDDLAREIKFARRTWQWKKKYGGIITSQIRRLGASCDLGTRALYPVPVVLRAVREAFLLFEKGLTDRGPRTINWLGFKVCNFTWKLNIHRNRANCISF